MKKIFVPVFLLFTWEIHSSPLLEVYGAIAYYSWYSSPMCSLRWEDWLASKKITQLVFVAFTQSHHHHISYSLGFFCCSSYLYCPKLSHLSRSFSQILTSSTRLKHLVASTILWEVRKLIFFHYFIWTWSNSKISLAGHWSISNETYI